MAGQVGALLQELRTRRGLSLGRLARAAGVDKSALSRWEAGTRQPRIVELEAALDALNASPGQRALALSHLDAPRALRRLRQIGADAAPGPLPMAGDLLRAMRLRRGWSQERTAQALGVNRSTIVRWERGERLPTAVQIHRLCYALGAAEAELIALTTGGFAAPPAVTAEGRRGVWDEKEMEFEGRLIRVHPALPPNGLEDLSYILLQRDLWRWAAREERARPLLAQAYIFQAQFSRNQGRWVAVGPLTERAASVAPPTQAEIAHHAAILNAAVTASGGERPSPVRAFRQLRRQIGPSVRPEYAAWMLRDMAEYAAQEGQMETSLTLAAAACEAAGRAHNPTEKFLRDGDYARHLLNAGRPEQALKVVPNGDNHSYPNDLTDWLLLHAEIRLRLGAPSESHDWLQRAYVTINHCSLESHRPKADALAARF